MAKLTKKNVEDALRHTDANFTQAAKRLKVARKSVYEAVERFELKHVVRECREEMVDIAEGALHNLVRNETPGAVYFYLKMMGKNRGYVDRVESTGADGGPINVQALDRPPRAATIDEWIGDKNRLAASLGE